MGGDEEVMEYLDKLEDVRGLEDTISIEDEEVLEENHEMYDESQGRKKKPKHHYKFPAIHNINGTTYYYVSQAPAYKLGLRVYDIALYADKSCKLWNSSQPIDTAALEREIPGHGFFKLHIV